jgi:hypothetical protein
LYAIALAECSNPLVIRKAGCYDRKGWEYNVFDEMNTP